MIEYMAIHPKTCKCAFCESERKAHPENVSPLETVFNLLAVSGDRSDLVKSAREELAKLRADHDELAAMYSTSTHEVLQEAVAGYAEAQQKCFKLAEEKDRLRAELAALKGKP